MTISAVGVLTQDFGFAILGLELNRPREGSLDRDKDPERNSPSGFGIDNEA